MANVMAPIASGKFFWITLIILAGCVIRSGQAMWFGILAASVLSYATVASYLKPAGLRFAAGGSYLFAED